MSYFIEKNEKLDNFKIASCKSVENPQSVVILGYGTSRKIDFIF